MSVEQVEVTQADREAAVPILRELNRIGVLNSVDFMLLLQRAFARHRLAASAPMSALPEDDGKLIEQLRQLYARYPLATSTIKDAIARIETLSREIETARMRLAAVDLLVGDGFAESVHAALDEIGVPRQEGPITFGIIQRIERVPAHVRAETLEEAAKVANGIAAYARRQAERQPAEWTTAAETAELISDKLRSLTTGSAAEQETNDE